MLHFGDLFKGLSNHVENIASGNKITNDLFQTLKISIFSAKKNI
jgi:hypothetical protein